MKDIGQEEAPLGRPGMPIEVAVAYVFLASPMGSYFTGMLHHVLESSPFMCYVC